MQIWQLLRLVRWKNLLIVFFTQLFAFTFLQQDVCVALHLHWQILLTIVATLSLAAAGYVINDYSDIKIDAVNKPENLIVGKYIERRKVLVMHLALNAIGIISASFVSLIFGLLCLAIAYVLWRYSVSLKYRFMTGNLLVSALMGLSLLVLYFASGNILAEWILFYAFFAFFTGLIREIIKDVEDKEGDAQYGAQTLINELGLFKTKLVLYYLLLIVISLLVLCCVYLFYKDYIVLPAYLIISTLLPFIIYFIWLTRADAKKDFSRLSFVIKIIMLAGVGSMALRCL